MKAIPILLALTAAWGQTQTATVRGTVRDASGGAVPAATVSLSNQDRQQQWTARTAGNGEYTIGEIPPGNYFLLVEATGFKKYERDGLIFQVAGTPVIDVALDLGSITETVHVTEETPLLETASSFLGEVIGARSAEALPLVSRNITQLVVLAPGVADTPNFRGPDFSSGIASRVQFSASGGRGATNEIMLDGSPQTVMDLNQPAYIPQPEAVQEFNVQTNSLPAEYGRTGGAVINIVHHSGGKDFHGELYEFLRNDAFNANDFFSNAQGKAKARYRGNEFGFALGGPASRSRKSTFFFVNYQRILITSPSPATFTIPTPKMKTGDFSEAVGTKGLASPVYDPLSVDSSGNRQPFPNNYIPPARWNPVGVNLLKFYPDPTSPGTTNNFFNNSALHGSATDLSVKIDRNITDRNRLFGRFSFENWDNTSVNRFGNVASPDAGPKGNRNHSATLDDTHSIGTWLLHANFGYAFNEQINDPAAPGFDLTSLGFPAYLKNAPQIANVPTILFLTGYLGLGDSGGVGTSKFENYAASADAAKITGAHAVKFGGAYRVNRASLLNILDASGSFKFSEGFTRPSVNSPQGGNAFASLLLGLPAVPAIPGPTVAGSIGYQPALALQARYVAFYLQDDWRINDRLTLDLGLRWDSDRPVTERFNRTSWFDFGAALPLTVPGLDALTGGLRFAGVNGAPRGTKNPDNNNLGPRIGVAYKLSRNTALRSGFGIMYAPATGIRPNTSKAGADSFSSSTPYISSMDSGGTPYTTLSNPFPNGFTPVENADHGLRTLLGQNIQAQVRGDRTPYVAQWHFNIQRELRNEMLFDVGYAGSAGVKLLAVMQLNQLPDQYLALGSALTQHVPNPFFGLDCGGRDCIPPTAPLGQSTTTLGQLLRPYPQFGDVTYDWGSFAHSTYHALEAKFRKRYRGGLQMLVAYTWSKTLDNASGVATGNNPNPAFLDNYHLDLAKSYSSFDIPHHVVMNFEYELPFGLGRPLLNQKGLVNAIIGGWRISGIGTMESGPPLPVSTSNNTNSFNVVANAVPNRTGVSSRTPGSVEDRLNNYIDRAAFVNPPPFTFGNAGRFLPENRAPGLETWDLSFAKSFPVRERIHIDLRAETFNLLNHPNFGPPANNFNLPNFGTINSVARPRVVQLALKIRF
jgi:hypothetical protein